MDEITPLIKALDFRKLTSRTQHVLISLHCMYGNNEIHLAQHFQTGKVKKTKTYQEFTIHVCTIYVHVQNVQIKRFVQN
jgi:hypothetical protein